MASWQDPSRPGGASFDWNQTKIDRKRENRSYLEILEEEVGADISELGIPDKSARLDYQAPEIRAICRPEDLYRLRDDACKAWKKLSPEKVAWLDERSKTGACRETNGFQTVSSLNSALREEV
jgi:hypothetical protein